MFNERRERSWLPSKSKLFDVLLNYVLSPALLIYAVILYLYFIKIAVLWSLPKGAVASIVVSFTAAAFILKGCQVFLTRRYYDWFYDHASLAVFPALVMFWIGTLYLFETFGRYVQYFWPSSPGYKLRSPAKGSPNRLRINKMPNV